MVQYDNIEHEKPSLFDDGQEVNLESTCVRLFEIRKKMLEDSQHDPEEYPTPTKLADKLGLTLDATMQLIEFVDTEFADWRLQRIQDVQKYIITDEGRIADPFTREPIE